VPSPWPSDSSPKALSLFLLGIEPTPTFKARFRGCSVLQNKLRRFAAWSRGELKRWLGWLLVSKLSLAMSLFPLLPGNRPFWASIRFRLMAKSRKLHSRRSAIPGISGFDGVRERGQVGCSVSVEIGCHDHIK